MRYFQRLVVAMVMSSSVGAAAYGATFQIDPAHTGVIFKVGHLGISKIYGRFNQVSGSFATDDATGALTAATIEARTESVDTGVGRRDNHLRSADFFNAVQFPVIRFVSSNVRVLENRRFELAGELSLHGVTRPVTLVVTQVGSGTDASGTTRIGAEGALTVRRSDFGMTNLMDTAGDEINLLLAFEGFRQ